MLWMKTIKQSHWRQISISFDVIVSPLLVSKAQCDSLLSLMENPSVETSRLQQKMFCNFNLIDIPVLKGHLMQYAFNLLTWWQIEKGLRLYHFSPGYWFNILFGRKHILFQSWCTFTRVFMCWSLNNFRSNQWLCSSLNIKSMILHIVLELHLKPCQYRRWTWRSAIITQLFHSVGSLKQLLLPQSLPTTGDARTGTSCKMCPGRLSLAILPKAGGTLQKSVSTWRTARPARPTEGMGLGFIIDNSNW